MDIAGEFSLLKDALTDEGFHLVGEHHYVDTLTMEQSFQVTVHPHNGCGKSMELSVYLEVSPRTMIAFENAANDKGELVEGFTVPLIAEWECYDIEALPDLLNFSMEIHAVGGDLPLTVRAMDEYVEIMDPPSKRLAVVAEIEVDLVELFTELGILDDTLIGKLVDISEFLVSCVHSWNTENRSQ